MDYSTNQQTLLTIAMTTIAQVIEANERLNAAIENYTAMRDVRPMVGRISFALEEAQEDAKADAKKTMLQRFKEMVRRVIEWFKNLFKKKQKEGTTVEDLTAKAKQASKSADDAVQSATQKAQENIEKFKEAIKPKTPSAEERSNAEIVAAVAKGAAIKQLASALEQKSKDKLLKAAKATYHKAMMQDAGLAKVVPVADKVLAAYGSVQGLRRAAQDYQQKVNAAFDAVISGRDPGDVQSISKLFDPEVFKATAEVTDTYEDKHVKYIHEHVQVGSFEGFGDDLNSSGDMLDQHMKLTEIDSDSESIKAVSSMVLHYVEVITAINTHRTVCLATSAKISTINERFSTGESNLFANASDEMLEEAKTLFNQKWSHLAYDESIGREALKLVQANLVKEVIK